MKTVRSLPREAMIAATLFKVMVIESIIQYAWLRQLPRGLFDCFLDRLQGLQLALLGFQPPLSWRLMTSFWRRAPLQASCWLHSEKISRVHLNNIGVHGTLR